jgi:hypothetical protein
MHWWALSRSFYCSALARLFSHGVVVRGLNRRRRRRLDNNQWNLSIPSPLSLLNNLLLKHQQLVNN